MSVRDRLNKFNQQLPENVTLVAVTKTFPDEVIMEAYNAGHRHFGENRVQELINKAATLPKDIIWHMIGHLQTNKVKFIAPFIDLIHGVDSLRLLRVINREALKNERQIPCLLQVHIARESSKFGFTEEELIKLLEDIDLNELKNIQITGLMGMATFTDDKKIIEAEFIALKKLFDQIKQRFFKDKSYFCNISMGMSNDYKIAIESGSTIIRIGSALFGDE